MISCQARVLQDIYIDIWIWSTILKIGTWLHGMFASRQAPELDEFLVSSFFQASVSIIDCSCQASVLQDIYIDIWTWSTVLKDGTWLHGMFASSRQASGLDEFLVSSFFQASVSIIDCISALLLISGICLNVFLAHLLHSSPPTRLAAFYESAYIMNVFLNFL